MKTYLQDEQLAQPSKILNEEKKEKEALGTLSLLLLEKRENKIHSNKTDETFVKETGHFRYVKVNLNGLLIGRNVDLNDHDFYEFFTQILENSSDKAQVMANK